MRRRCGVTWWAVANADCRFPWSSPVLGCAFCVSFAQGRGRLAPGVRRCFLGGASLRDTLKAEATRGSGRELRLVPCTDETPKGAPREEDTKNRRPAVPNWLSEAVVSSGQAWRWNGIDENYEVAGPHSRSRTLDRRGGSSRVGPSVRACK
jgi:hypothetical protein